MAHASPPTALAGLALGVDAGRAGSRRNIRSIARRSRSRYAAATLRAEGQATSSSCYMDGGPSQIDTFDPKPRLREGAHAADPDGGDADHRLQHLEQSLRHLLSSFKQHGQSGTPGSATCFRIWPTCVDDMCIVRSMVAELLGAHLRQLPFIHSGSGFQGRPSMGAWITYGLGSECDNLPGFVVLDSGLIPPGGMDCFASGFLPASYQGTLFRQGEHPIADLAPREPTRRYTAPQARSAWRSSTAACLTASGKVSELEATITNYELAFRMQSAVPELLDLTGESEATKQHLRARRGRHLRVRQAVPVGAADGRARRALHRVADPAPQAAKIAGTSTQRLSRGPSHERASDGQVRSPACSRTLKSRGLLDETLIDVGRRVRAHADGADRQEPRHGADRPRPQTPSGSPCGSPAAV